MANELAQKNGVAEALALEAPQVEEQSPLRQQLAQEPGIEQQSQLLKPEAAKQAGEFNGPIARLFNRILGVDEKRTDTKEMAFSRDQFRQYLDGRLQLAEGEWFRGAKLDGVADKLTQMLDKDGNGLIGWAEFQAFRTEILAQIAPGAESAETEERIHALAAARFAQVDKSKDGRLGMGELQAGAKAQLPKGTDHADLIAQLGARIAIDAGDTDQSNKPIADRDLTLDEWTAAAVQLAFTR